MPKKINEIIKFLMYGDFILSGGWALLAPVFALFLVQEITGGSTQEAAKVAGFAALTYWIVKSFLQIPIGAYLDKNHGEKDDFWFLIAGNLFTAIAPLGFMISSRPEHIYFFHIMHAIGMALVVPSWLAIFTRHIDKGSEAYEWSISSTFLGFGSGIGGAIGGLIAGMHGFRLIFLLISFFTVLSTVFFLFIKKEILGNS